MNRILPYIKVIRPVNLLMIALTQYLFWWHIVLPTTNGIGLMTSLQTWEVLLLMFTTVAIAAGGYVINDYYDLPIDLVNKPDKVIVSKSIGDEAAFNYYTVLTVAGLIAGGVVAYMQGNYSLAIFPVVMSGMLWFYAQQFKRQPFIGNLVIALCTAGVICILIVYEVDFFAEEPMLQLQMSEIIKYGRIYMLFALLTTLMREVVKDLQDLEGDRRFDCKTLPVVWGVPASKMVGAFWTVCLMGLAGYLQYLFLKFGNKVAFGYLLAAVQIPSLVVLGLLIRAGTPAQFKAISLWIKIIMALGILSMIYIGFLLGKYA